MTVFSKMRKSYTKSPKKVVYKKQRPELIMARYIPRDMPEVKTRDTALSLTSGTNSAFGTPQVLNNIGLFSSAAPSVAVDARIGRKIFMTSITMKLTVPTTPGRLIVVYDKQSNAAAPVITDILLADAFDSPNNLSNRDRFVTLMDVVTPAIGTSGDYAVAGVGYKRLNLETMFNAGSAGTIGDITSGSIYVFAASSNSFLTTALVQLTRARIRYSDV